MRLLVDQQNVSELTIASTPSARRTGLLGIDGFDGALWFPGIRSVHTFRMRFAIDVAYLDKSGTVLKTQSMAPGRLGPWVRRAAGVLEAEAGEFEKWHLQTGSLVQFS